jgi:hypothetical protein
MLFILFPILLLIYIVILFGAFLCVLQLIVARFPNPNPWLTLTPLLRTAIYHYHFADYYY